MINAIALTRPAGSHFIDGQLVAGAGERVDAIYPATGAAFAQIAWATDAEIERAVESAQRGFAIWRKASPAQRGRVLRRAAEILRARNAEWAAIETLDTGKAIQETEAVDIASGADALEYFGALAATMTGEHIGFSGEDGDWAYTVRRPLGVCVGICAWNYPMQIACWKTAAALACGNSMILKPAELTPTNALNLGLALKEAGLPDGVFTVLQGDGRVGAALAAHPAVAKVSLTGESSTGVKVLQGAAPGLKHVSLELGGKSPMVVFADADLDNAVSGAMLANFYSTGQVCSNGTRVFVQRAARDAFAAKLIARVEAMRIGDPLDPQTHMGPLVSAEHLGKVRSYYDIARKEASMLLDRADVTPPQGFEGGYWAGPMVISGDDAMRTAREEVFGPLLTLLSFDDEDEAVTRANDTEYGLSAAVFTADLTRAHRVIGQLEAGTCWINNYNITPVEAPFGGVKRSGIGRENGRAALEAYSEAKSIYVGMTPVQAPY